MKNSIKIASILFLVMVVIFVFSKSPRKLDTKNLLEEFGKCQNSSNHFGCLNQLANDLIDRHDVQDISAAILEISGDDRVRDCHRFGHFVGNRLYRNTKSLKDSLGACGDFCFGGCYHGVAEEMFGQKLRTTGEISKEDFSSDLTSLEKHCLSLDTNEQSKCYQNLGDSLHGLGHAFMFVTENEVPDSLELCDLAGEAFSLETSCYDGVFMSNNEALNDPNHFSNYIKEGDLIFPCNILDYQYKEVCYKSKADYFLNNTPDKNIETCKQFPEEFQKYCFEQSARMISTQSFEPKGLKDGCDLVPQEHKDECVYGLMVLITGKFPYTSDIALGFCNLYDGSFKETCLGYFGEQMVSRGWGEEFQKNVCLGIVSPKPNWCNSVLK